MATYAEQLKHPLWQKKRLEVLQRFEFTCQKCFDKETTLHVHHKQYMKGRAPWEYDDANFTVLCEVCHEDVHQINDNIKASLARIDPIFLDDLAELLEILTLEIGDSRIYQIAALAGGFAVAAGPRGEPYLHALRRRMPVIFHYGVLAGVLIHERHRDGAAQREAALLEHAKAHAAAWDFLGLGWPMLDRLDKIPEEKRTSARHLELAQREDDPPV